MRRAILMLGLLALTSCALHGPRSCGNLEDGERRPACLIDICPCDEPWVALDPCCLPLGAYEASR